jgi:hypothetical protein
MDCFPYSSYVWLRVLPDAFEKTDKAIARRARPRHCAFHIDHSFRINLQMEDEGEEIVEVRIELPREVYELACQAARKRRMAVEDFLSVVTQCHIRGTRPLWRKH